MRTCFVDYRISQLEEKKLKDLNLNIIKVPKHPKLYDAIDGHPDIQINILNENTLLLAKDSSEELFNSVPKDLNIIKSSYNLEDKYPGNVILNAVNLLIPSGDISLPGLDYGFIGGTCGLISKNQMAFFGNLENHSYGNDIKNFLLKYDVEPIYLSNGKLIDRGSILTI